ncbi:unnamed protein product, partial [Rotaria magnacalcarata]
QLPILYTLTKKNSNFLLFNGSLGGKRGLIFASIDDIKYLAYQKFWYADGTFYTSPSIFYQIYSIHAFDEGLSTPCAYALLADKSEETYYDLFSTLIKNIIEISNMIKLEYITIDFEAAVKNVFYKHYPHIQVALLISFSLKISRLYQHFEDLWVYQFELNWSPLQLEYYSNKVYKDI